MKNVLITVGTMFSAMIIGCALCFYFGYKSGDEKRMEWASQYELMGGFIMPVSKENIVAISSDQGLREVIGDAEGGQTSGLYHNGLDIACVDKTPVMAAQDGVVISCYPGYYNGRQWKGHQIYGGVVILEHENSQTLYSHLSLTKVKEGQQVKQGDVIGLSGGVRGRRASGISSGCHLHFAIYPRFEKLIIGGVQIE